MSTTVATLAEVSRARLFLKTIGASGMPPLASGVGSGGGLYGGGGSGGTNSGSQVARASAAGANGIVIVTEYYAP